MDAHRKSKTLKTERRRCSWKRLPTCGTIPALHLSQKSEGGLAELHVDFIPSFAVPYEKVSSMSPATPQRVQKKITGMVTSLTRIISNWERSGQGDEGGLHENGAMESDHPLFGTFADREAAASEFANAPSARTTRPTLFYFWNILEKHPLLRTSLNAQCLLERQQRMEVNLFRVSSPRPTEPTEPPIPEAMLNPF
ncbi:hypothetical protein IV203_025577 [Nitzschia inconspicua]|uniref:Uncharacterized protein n=1 Tax=Nitzschia inconspicua TaxID=303405 RepID=A0A9K3KAJ5_9STRA|nr:hypothetical protein IV203_017645 [Nitzschia inconspicua]KAG7339903.1 hypothetical protein IV203_024953 [Nitzschia inconspicua]KAG7361911.1 hypothetical protein IV203_025577 [Nitzschia inconspicua]